MKQKTREEIIEEYRIAKANKAPSERGCLYCAIIEAFLAHEINPADADRLAKQVPGCDINHGYAENVYGPSIYGAALERYRNRETEIPDCSDVVKNPRHWQDRGNDDDLPY